MAGDPWRISELCFNPKLLLFLIRNLTCVFVVLMLMVCLRISLLIFGSFVNELFENKRITRVLSINGK
jgi:hypothetical protein